MYKGSIAMKKIILLTAAFLSALTLTGCDQQSTDTADQSADKNYRITTHKYDDGNYGVQFDMYEEVETPSRIKNVSAVDNDIYFTIEENDHSTDEPQTTSTLYKFTKSLNEPEKCFEFANGSSPTDNVFIHDGILFYDSVDYYNLLAYDMKTMEQKTEYAIPNGVFKRTYAKDMQTVIDLTEEGMLLEDLSPENEQMSEFIFTPDEGQYRSYDWSDDCSKIVLSNYIDEIMTLDIEEKYPLKVDTESIENALPSTLVDFGQCYVNSNGEVGINALCENGVVIVLTDFYGKFSEIIASEWDANIIDMNNEFVLYLVKNQDGAMEINLYNIAEKVNSTLISSKSDKYTDASLDEHSIIYSGFNTENIFVRTFDLQDIVKEQNSAKYTDDMQ